MLKIERSDKFLAAYRKIKNKADQIKVKKQIKKILDTPEIGKPMRYARQGTREVYVGSFRPSYAYLEKYNKLIFLDLYH